VGRLLLWVGLVLAALTIGSGLSDTAVGQARSRFVVRLSGPGLGARDNRTNAFGANPDAAGAVGRLHYLEAVKSRLALYDRRTLREVAVRDANRFWGVLPTSGQLTDPQVSWDLGARRWYYAAALTSAGGNALMLAWSKTGDPGNLTTGWCRIRIGTGAAFDDFPHMGYSGRAIVIAATSFDLRNDRYRFARVWVIAKPGPGCRRPLIRQLRIRRVGGRAAVSLIAVNPVRSSATAYVVAADCVAGDRSGEEEASCPRSGRRINVWKVTGKPRTPRLIWIGAVSVAPFTVPSPAALPGGATVDSSDTRLLQAVSAPDPTLDVPVAIWTAHAVSGPRGRAVVRWIELDPRGPRVLRQGTIADARNWVFNPAISPTRRGDAAVITFNVAGPSLLPVIRARFRVKRTPRGVMTGQITLASSNASEASCPLDPGETCPWGDYAAAAPDPLRADVVWGSNMVIGAPTPKGPFHWTTQNFATRVG
jgi:hypothetical protein